ncbi:bifunctional 4-hydroxy-2-oxoglutarate aldolase/2-dehydro-3-deoxy-phosphogluconate aldolase [Phormidium sp. CCY1219]|uniref:bifunctional 4-hydroxy-2-oxoglutarate aldolase/2-dehydro-3-deoxy-phosphogluconate aldolase n=1 Tax=Phormidium sp. CCY1219 TaxID=2886104 RepID=UPI002D1F2BAA|nr:bifunctional 4-hydroxy-2-oxoglutarate aldolase/2-dehydro-3-deoxy-phosphogluconate aldolase [Phormidium sp. CCY1219]MEB3831358.1 bifunctional 4-hydroxy-2-oxoglutarate aldolase/2-dehydro-3-deoxy-phosphogluconate aldolase [Phormidium sp. CCY1219]
MSDKSWLKLLQQQPAIAVIRAPTFQLGYEMATAVARGGMKTIEITWNSDRAADLIDVLRSDLPLCTIGTGTVLNMSQLQSALAAGAQFLFTPHTDLAIVQVATSAGVPIVPGALSPTEIITAWQAGASSVKVFPISAMGGPGYIKSLQGPLGHIPLIPTGGVTLENARAFLEAGAITVGLAGDLFPPDSILAGDWQAIAERAQKLIERIKNIDGDREAPWPKSLPPKL